MDVQTLMRHDYVLLDGAMGTMLQQKGLKPGENTALTALNHPDWLEEIHRAYLEAGSDIVYTDTFGANREKLAPAGLTPEEAIAAAVACARRACTGREALVALDVGPLGRLLEPAGELTLAEACALFGEMMEAGERAGADLIVLETMADLQELRAALIAARERTCLPVLCTMTFDACGRTYMGTSIPALALTAEALGAAAVGINCSLGPRQLPALMAQLMQWTRLPLIAKPNAGLPGRDGGYDITPEEFAESQRALAEQGVQLLGGCCGTDPRYLSLLKEALDGLHREVAARAVPEAVCNEGHVLTLSAAQRRSLTVEPETDEEELLDDALEAAEGENVLLCLRGDDADAMERAVQALRGGVGAPLAMESRNPAAVEQGLRLYCGRGAVIGSPMDKELAAAAERYGAVMIGEDA